MIDFSEIEPSDSGRGLSDRFELFARDFLEIQGFKIVQNPGRGSDRQKDLIVSEERTGVGGRNTIKWLVSCKNFSGSKRSVTLSDENDIYDRVLRHSCGGFLGFYSTIPSSGLNDKLYELAPKIEVSVFDRSLIERHLIKPQFSQLLIQYFPKSAAKHRSLLEHNSKPKQMSRLKKLDRAMLIEASLTAAILMELLEIKDNYFGHRWEDKSIAINKLYKFSDNSNEEVATEILSFIERASAETRAGMPDHIALAIQALVLNYFPVTVVSGSANRDYLGELCVEIGFNLFYDSIKYTQNLMIAAYGLSVIKHVKLCAERKHVKSWSKAVKDAYARMENLVSNNATNPALAGELLKVFKKDLKTKYLGFPEMSEELFRQLTLKRR